MNFAKRILASNVVHGGWFQDLDRRDRKEYVEQHPNSKYAKDPNAKEGVANPVKTTKSPKPIQPIKPAKPTSPKPSKPKPVKTPKPEPQDIPDKERLKVMYKLVDKIDGMIEKETNPERRKKLQDQAQRVIDAANALHDRINKAKKKKPKKKKSGIAKKMAKSVWNMGMHIFKDK